VLGRLSLIEEGGVVGHGIILTILGIRGNLHLARHTHPCGRIFTYNCYFMSFLRILTG
jgi:hypothetical protein